MEGDEHKTEEKTSIHVSPKVEAKPIFSQREIRRIIKDFISAWISGQIKLSLVTHDELIAYAKRAGENLNYKEAIQHELDNKATFQSLIGICSGTIKATQEEQQKAMCDLFSYILTLRNGDRIQGKFMDYELEERIHRLEDGLSITNNLVEQIVEWLYRGKVEP